ncbi:hypothetical protein [Sphingobium sp. WCS2017Hpa-17]|uniref:hypothetical protein n=1 Tax=Sphingobium sp. WCS2017Hpa-17 TaxID=3073638 RepID=UPI00288AB3DD|nr:hypothetical protein [Sphingobium sp. WCS2017Hpa-17]
MQDEDTPFAAKALTRMAALFGRAALLPVVQGLEAELHQAIDQPDTANAHRIAGLAGTLGFVDASASWQAVDQSGGDIDIALRDSRIALVAIDGWLRQGE